MKPSPKAAPMSPMPFARFSEVVESAMNAWAVDTVAPEMPAQIRDTNRSGSDPAKPKTRYDAADQPSPSRRIGRRPTRSESRPQSGMKTNCIPENETASQATVCALPPKRSA